MNVLDACHILQQAKKGVVFPKSRITEAKNIVAVAQAEFIALKVQIKNNEYSE